jgi:cob(I)alamin adenosyltransferase
MSNSITTRQGDRGTTFLFSGEEVSKASLRTNAYGDIDELVSTLGVARATVTDDRVRDTVLELQNALFIVGSELATSSDNVHLLKQRIGAAELARLDAVREEAEASIVMPSTFILPGGTQGAAFLDLARTVARRCERKIVHLQEEGLIANPELVVWMNRLSDTLWLLARMEEGDAVRERS